jgi:hypothetical protein
MEPMEGRWVCRRCFASNEAGATTCEQCGLERGADPNQAAPYEPPATHSSSPLPGAGYGGQGQADQWTPPQAAPRPGWLSLALRFAWIPVVLIVLAAGWYFSARRDDSGQIANVGDMQVEDLRVGDCFDLKDPEATEVAEVEAKPCTTAHKYELFHDADMPDGEFPSDAAVETFVQAECVPAFTAYVGMDYADSALYFSWFAPSTETWDDGDRTVQCAAYEPDANLDPIEVTGTFRNAAR